MKAFKVPHTLVLLFGMILLAYALTWILPAGTYQMATSESGANVVVPGTFALVEEQKQLPIWTIFTTIPKGLESAQGIIFFLFLVGGSLAVLRETGAIDALLGKLLARFSHKPTILLLISMLAFMVGSSTIGMAEEYIPLVLILITLCVALKLDTVSAVGSMVVGYGLGYGTAVLNPFTILVAQDVAQVQLVSGWEFRLVLFIPFFLIGFLHLRKYALKVQQDPANSVVFGVESAQPPVPGDFPALTGKLKMTLAVAFVFLVVIVVGIAKYQWYFVELGALFLFLAIITSVLNGQGLSDSAKVFGRGAAELTETALLIGFARSIEMVLSDGQVLHTIIHYMSQPLSAVGAEISAVGMLLLQSLLNFFIPSGSGQAYVSIPIMAPIADLVGVSRQVSVLAFQMGDGFMNMIVPTNPVLMGILGMAGIPYDRWLKFIGPLMLKLLAFGAVVMVFAVVMGYQ